MRRTNTIGLLTTKVIIGTFLATVGPLKVYAAGLQSTAEPQLEPRQLKNLWLGEHKKMRAYGNTQHSDFKRALQGQASGDIAQEELLAIEYSMPEQLSDYWFIRGAFNQNHDKLERIQIISGVLTGSQTFITKRYSKNVSNISLAVGYGNESWRTELEYLVLQKKWQIQASPLVNDTSTNLNLHTLDSTLSSNTVLLNFYYDLSSAQSFVRPFVSFTVGLSDHKTIGVFGNSSAGLVEHSGSARVLRPAFGFGLGALFRMPVAKGQWPNLAKTALYIGARFIDYGRPYWRMDSTQLAFKFRKRGFTMSLGVQHYL